MSTVPNRVSPSGGVVIIFPSAAMIPPVQSADAPRPQMALRDLDDSYSGVETQLIDAGVVLRRLAEQHDNGTLRAIAAVLQVLATEVARQAQLKRSAAAEAGC